MCDIMLFDEEGDRHVIISWELALNATMVKHTASGASLANDPSVLVLTGVDPADAAKGNLVAWARLAAAWSMWNTDPNPDTQKDVFKDHLDKASAALKPLVTVPAVGDLATKAAQYNALIKFPMPVITICRPFLEHLMHSCILTVAGRDTGATLFGPADSAPSLCARPLFFFCPTARTAAAHDWTCDAAQCNCRQTPKSRRSTDTTCAAAAHAHAAIAGFGLHAASLCAHVCGPRSRSQTGHFKAVITKCAPPPLRTAAAVRHASLTLPGVALPRAQATERVHTSRRGVRRLRCGRQLPLFW